MIREKPCKFAVHNGGEVWECGAHPKVYCTEQQFDRNPDGSVNIVMCGWEPPKKEKPMRNPCKECICYHKENNTCQSKKCATGGPGYITAFDRLFCKPCKPPKEE